MRRRIRSHRWPWCVFIRPISQWIVVVVVRIWRCRRWIGEKRLIGECAKVSDWHLTCWCCGLTIQSKRNKKKNKSLDKISDTSWQRKNEREKCFLLGFRFFLCTRTWWPPKCMTIDTQRNNKNCLSFGEKWKIENSREYYSVFSFFLLFFTLSLDSSTYSYHFHHFRRFGFNFWFNATPRNAHNSSSNAPEFM